MALRNIQPDEFTRMQCALYSEYDQFTRYESIENNAVDFSPEILAFLKELNSQAPDLFDGENPDNSPVVAGFMKICKTAQNDYFVMFYSVVSNHYLLTKLVPEVYAGGGQGLGDPHIGVLLSTGEKKVFRRLGEPGIKLSFTEAERDSETTSSEDKPTYRQAIAYYSCGTIAGYRNNQLYVTCGGGDGPGSSSSLVALDIQRGIQNEEYFCLSLMGNTHCKDKSGQMYIRRVSHNTQFP